LRIAAESRTHGASSGGAVSFAAVLAAPTKETVTFPMLQSIADCQSTADCELGVSARFSGDRAARPAAPEAGPLVLVVDDEPLVRSALKLLLKSRAYRVLEASDGLGALRLYAHYREEIALVITEMAMHRASGPGLIGAIKGLNSRTNIIAYTSTVRAEDLGARCAGQFFAFLPKPCPNYELLLAVAAGVACRPQARPSPTRPLPSPDAAAQGTATGGPHICVQA
jgi:CheY-like chemotaxis protein